MRSQAMAIFFSIGLGTGGVMAPTIFGYIISLNSREAIAYGYYCGNEKNFFNLQVLLGSIILKAIIIKYSILIINQGLLKKHNKICYYIFYFCI